MYEVIGGPFHNTVVEKRWDSRGYYFVLRTKTFDEEGPFGTVIDLEQSPGPISLLDKAGEYDWNHDKLVEALNKSQNWPLDTKWPDLKRGLDWRFSNG